MACMIACTYYKKQRIIIKQKTHDNLQHSRLLEDIFDLRVSDIGDWGSFSFLSLQIELSHHPAINGTQSCFYKL